MPVARRVSALQPTAVNSILAEVRHLQRQGRAVVSLMRGEPDFRTPEHIVEAAIRSLHKGRTGYPDNRGEIALRRAVAAHLPAARDPETEVLITPGATFGIYAALQAVLNEGDQVLLPDPVYDAYLSPIRLAGAEPVAVHAAIAGGRFVLNVEALREAWTPRCRMLLLNTPWNPTGTVFTRAEMEAIGEFCAARDLLLLCDEIYEAITYDGARHVSSIEALPDLRDRIILINALSKTYAMTGWRVGYVAAPAEIVQAMFLVLQQSSRGPATFVQDAAVAALEGPRQPVEAMRAEYARRRGQVMEALAGVPGCAVLPPQGGFFAMADVRGLGLPSNEVRRKLLEESGVVVVHGAAYGAGGEGTLRVSFASGGDTLAEGLRRLRAGLASISAS